VSLAQTIGIGAGLIWAETGGADSGFAFLTLISE
jgi:hypothetical protein